MTIQPREKLEELLRLLGFEAAIQELPAGERGVVLNVQTEESGRLIGRKGQTLAALQFVLNRLLLQADPAAPRVTVDVAEYRAHAQDELAQKAKAAAEKVRRWGDVIELEPMNSFERRVVHQALKDDPDVETHSIPIHDSEQKVIQLRPKGR